MDELALTILSSAAVSATLAGALVWLTKTWISERLKGAISLEYDQKLESHKAQLKSQSDTEVERLKAQLSISATEHQVRFSGLHNKRAEVIAETYSLLVQAYRDTSSFVSPVEYGGEPDKKQKYVTAMNSMAAFYGYFDKNRIYLPEEICAQCEGYIQGMREKAVHFGIYLQYDDAALPDHAIRQKHDAWTAAWDHISKEIPKLRASLEKELRHLLGDRPN